MAKTPERSDEAELETDEMANAWPEVERRTGIDRRTRCGRRCGIERRKSRPADTRHDRRQRRERRNNGDRRQSSQ